MSWSVEQRAWVLSLLVLVIGTAFTCLGAEPPMTGADWIGLVKWLIGLNLAGSAGMAVARPAGDVLAAKAGQLKAALAARSEPAR
jgi:hypothetical protein